ncbi:MAG TPA: glycosyltransferase family 9 protein [Chroococcales cyanobacterium]
MTNYIAPISWGLGDLIVSLPAVQSLIATGQPTYLVTRHSLQTGLSSRITGIAGEVSESALKDIRLGPADRYFNLREHPLQTDYFWGSPEFSESFPSYKIDDILSRIANDLGLECDFGRLQPLAYNHDNRVTDAVLLIPGSDGQYKWWPTANWLEIFQCLKERGIRSYVIGQPESCPAVKELLSRGIPWIETATLSDAVDAISSAQAVLAVDTGLMHLSVNQGIPTVALYRPDPIYIRHHDHVVAITGGLCAADCLRNLYGSTVNQFTEFIDFAPRTWDCNQPLEARCMASISVESVIDALGQLRITTSQDSKIAARTRTAPER